MSLSNKTSLKVPYQLPEFIRSDENYQTFVAFIQAYYEWMEQNNIGDSKQGVIYSTQNLLNYSDVDYIEPGDSFNKFIDYFTQEFLPNFPKDALTDKTKLIKIAKQLYKTKGTPSSYKFLFRALYNSDVQLFETREQIFKASDGKWYVSKSLRLNSSDENFLSTNNLRIFGEKSKSIATIERGVLVNGRIELYISNIERLFESGETIRVTDNNNRTLYFKDGEIVPEGTTGSSALKAEILGSISSVNIKNNRRGQLYKGRTSTYSGDPVVFYGGIDQANGIGARAFVNETTSGSIRAVDVIQGSVGYRPDPNTYIRFTGGGGTGAIANVASVDPTGEINVAFVPQNFLSFAVQEFEIGEVYSFFPANTSATVNCSLANAFTFTGFSTYPLSAVIVNNGGGGYISLPSVKALSLYDTTDPQPAENLKIKGDLASLGILGPITIVSPGTGYANGDTIVFGGGTGYGAAANVKVNSTGSIISTEYILNTQNGVALYPKGGLGYKNSALPTLNVQSSNGSGASLIVTTVLGDGAVLQAVPDERGIGAITSFIIENFGEDYVRAPNVSLRVRDIVVNNVSNTNIVKTGELVYQGTSINTAVSKAFVDSITLLEPGDTQQNTRYLLRTYNYTSNTKLDLTLNVTDREDGGNIYMNVDTTYNTFDGSGEYLFRSGVRTYGNGAAEATARFLNGLIIGTGQYLNDDGFPSSYQILENDEYNNFTYQLVVQKSFSAYKEILYSLLHPSGTKVLPTNAIKTDQNVIRTEISAESNTLPLSYYTGTAGSNATVYGSFTNPSNNIIKFDALVGANIAQFINVNSFISISNTNGPNLYSKVISVDAVSNTVTVVDNVFLRFANVAIANVVNSNTRINIPSMTGQYDLINNGEYSNNENQMQDVFFAGDEIRIVSGSSTYLGTITYVRYSNNTIFVTPAPSFTNTNAIVSVGRNLVSNDIQIYNTLGDAGAPYLTTQSGDVIITQSNDVLTLGI